MEGNTAYSFTQFKAVVSGVEINEITSNFESPSNIELKVQYVRFLQ